METFVFVAIILAIIYIILRELWNRKPRPVKDLTPEGERTIDEIMAGRSFEEIREELDQKELEDLTANESWVLYNITIYEEQQRATQNTGNVNN